jgi:hypothetical protein
MDKDECPINEIRDLLFDDASLLITDEEIALHCMHRFNIDRDTMDSLPAFNEPLKTILWLDKK